MSGPMVLPKGDSAIWYSQKQGGYSYSLCTTCVNLQISDGDDLEFISMSVEPCVDCATK